MRLFLTLVIGLMAGPAFAQSSAVVLRTTQTVHRDGAAVGVERYLHGHAMAWTVVVIDPFDESSDDVGAAQRVLDVFDGHAAVFSNVADEAFYLPYQQIVPTRGVLISGVTTHLGLANAVKKAVLAAYDGTSVTVGVTVVINGVTVTATTPSGSIQSVW
jgi:hypothetical protein